MRRGGAARNRSIQRRWMSRSGTGLRSWSFSRPQRTVPIRLGSSTTPRCWLADWRAIRSGSHSSPRVWPFCWRSLSRSIRRVGSARARRRGRHRPRCDYAGTYLPISAGASVVACAEHLVRAVATLDSASGIGMRSDGSEGDKVGAHSARRITPAGSLGVPRCAQGDRRGDAASAVGRHGPHVHEVRVADTVGQQPGHPDDTPVVPGDGDVLRAFERAPQRAGRPTVVELVCGQRCFGPVPVDPLERVGDSHDHDPSMAWSFRRRSSAESCRLRSSSQRVSRNALRLSPSPKGRARGPSPCRRDPTTWRRKSESMFTLAATQSRQNSLPSISCIIRHASL